MLYLGAYLTKWHIVAGEANTILVRSRLCGVVLIFLMQRNLAWLALSTL